MMRDRTVEYAKGNAACAKIILATPETFGAGLVTWATMCLGRHGQQHAPTVASVATQDNGGQMEMFRQGEGAKARA